MKVGSDSVALGAWSIKTFLLRSCGASAPNVLDIGSGSGVLALMLAQELSGARVVAVEQEPEAANQARGNFARSCFASRIELIETSIQKLRGFDASFDLIVSNPPYFRESLQPTDRGRRQARHQNSLNYSDLLEAALRLLSQEGVFCVILPTSAAQSFVISAMAGGLWLLHETALRDRVGATAKRTLLAFSRMKGSCLRNELIMKEPSGRLSARFANLTGAFYL